MWTKKEAARHLDAHAGDWEKSQDRGALVREDDSEDGEGGLFASLPFPSGKDPPNKAPAKTSDGFRMEIGEVGIPRLSLWFGGAERWRPQRR